MEKREFCYLCRDSDPGPQAHSLFTVVTERFGIGVGKLGRLIEDNIKHVCGGLAAGGVGCVAGRPLLIMGGRPPASLLDVVIYSGLELTVGVPDLCRVFLVQVRLAPV